MLKLIIICICYLLPCAIGAYMPTVFSKIDKNFTFRADKYTMLFPSFPALVILLVYINTLSLLSISMCMFIVISLAIELSAAIMDYKYKTVYDIIHILAGICLVPIFIAYQKVPWEAFVILGVSLIMSFAYGLSDAMAFGLMGFVTECWLLTCEITPTFYLVVFNTLVLMTVSIFSCFFVQLFKKNVAKNGKFKNEVAFIPYIYVITCLIPVILLFYIK